jgi:hypothetical protein
MSHSLDDLVFFRNGLLVVGFIVLAGGGWLAKADAVQQRDVMQAWTDNPLRDCIIAKTCCATCGKPAVDVISATKETKSNGRVTKSVRAAIPVCGDHRMLNPHAISRAKPDGRSAWRGILTTSVVLGVLCLLGAVHFGRQVRLRAGNRRPS